MRRYVVESSPAQTICRSRSTPCESPTPVFPNCAPPAHLSTLCLESSRVHHVRTSAQTRHLHTRIFPLRSKSPCHPRRSPSPAHAVAPVRCFVRREIGSPIAALHNK